MRTFVGSICFALAAASASAAVQCNPDPIADDPDFSALAVKLEPDVLDRIVVACDRVSAAVDPLTGLMLGPAPGTDPVSALDTRIR